jgi:hypothetical protein
LLQSRTALALARVLRAMHETTLIFPAGMPGAQRAHAEARTRGAVIGSSSLEFDPARAEYESWEFLPYITDPCFDRTLTDVIRRRGVTAIYTPHFAAMMVLRERLATIAPGVRLLEGETIYDQQAAYRKLRLRLGEIALEGPTAPSWPGAKAALGETERTGLLRLIDTIPGMCSEEKMLALIDIARSCPSGDIVEIGSWWGRSAALLNWLGRRYEIGSTLCIDPWLDESLGHTEDILNRASALLDADEALRIFEINLAPLAQGTLNYLRLPGHEAAALYRPGMSATTSVFGTTTYRGQIALLHIDGNHVYERACEDVADWTPHVVPGGWVVIDDYVWPFGDGPRRAADEYLSRLQGKIDSAFVAGTALFAKRATT